MCNRSGSRWERVNMGSSCRNVDQDSCDSGWSSWWTEDLSALFWFPVHPLYCTQWCSFLLYINQVNLQLTFSSTFFFSSPFSDSSLSTVLMSDVTQGLLFGKWQTVIYQWCSKRVRRCYAYTSHQTRPSLSPPSSSAEPLLFLATTLSQKVFPLSSLLLACKAGSQLVWWQSLAGPYAARIVAAH